MCRRRASAAGSAERIWKHVGENSYGSNGRQIRPTLAAGTQPPPPSPHSNNRAYTASYLQTHTGASALTLLDILVIFSSSGVGRIRIPVTSSSTEGLQAIFDQST